MGNIRDYKLAIGYDGIPDAYFDFIDILRENATETWHEHINNVGEHVRVGTLRNTPDRVERVTITIDEEVFELHIRNSDMYFLAAKLQNINGWVSLGITPISLNGEMSTYYTGFPDSYGGMDLGDAARLESVSLGSLSLRNIMYELRRFILYKDESNIKNPKRPCVVISLMVCEAARFQCVFNDVINIYSSGGTLAQNAEMGQMIKSWARLYGDYNSEVPVYNEDLRLVKDPPLLQ